MSRKRNNVRWILERHFVCDRGEPSEVSDTNYRVLSISDEEEEDEEESKVVLPPPPGAVDVPPPPQQQPNRRRQSNGGLSRRGVPNRVLQSRAQSPHTFSTIGSVLGQNR